MKLGNVELDHVRGITDKVFGLGKEIVGTALNNDRLIKEGEAQQGKGTESPEGAAQAGRGPGEGGQGQRLRSEGARPPSARRPPASHSQLHTDTGRRYGAPLSRSGRGQRVTREAVAEVLLGELADRGLRHLVDEHDVVGQPPLGDARRRGTRAPRPW